MLINIYFQCKKHINVPVPSVCCLFIKSLICAFFVTTCFLSLVICYIVLILIKHKKMIYNTSVVMLLFCCFYSFSSFFHYFSFVSHFSTMLAFTFSVAAISQTEI